MVTLAALSLFVISAAPPAVVTALDCKARKCKLSKEKATPAGEVWKATLPKQKDEACREAPEEYWFVPRAGAAQLLVSLCNDGYGASGVGEDSIDVSDTTFTHSRYGGSAWRWTSGAVIGFSPFRLVSEQHQSFHATLPDYSKSDEWNWDTFSGKQKNDVGQCSKEGTTIDGSEAVSVEANLIPDVAAPPGFVDEGWKTTDLGACSAPASYVTFGSQRGEKDASMKVVGAGGFLFVEVRDDTWVEQAKKWTLADHLELWVGEPSDTWSECAGFRGGSQWAFGLDGTVNLGAGNPKKEAVGVELARAEGVVRMKVRLPRGASKRIGVVYSDSDDGAKQKALLATSALKFGDVATFSELKAIRAEEAVCVLDGKTLKPKITRTFEPKTPVIE